MKILIIGAGETGFYIASEFSEDNYDVTLVDENPIRLQEVSRLLNAAHVPGNGTSLPVLEQAGIQETDVLIACTDHDETNLISGLLAHHYKVPQKIVLTRTDSFLRRGVLARYIKAGITQIINSSVVTAQEILATATLASAAEVSAFGERNILLVGYKVKEDSPWNGLFLHQIRSPESQFLVASIVRDGRSWIPSGADQLHPGDYVYVLIPRHQAQSLNDILNVKISSNRRAVVAGASQIAQRVAMGLLKSHYTVTMICDDMGDTAKMRKKYSHKKHFQAVTGACESVKLQLQTDVAVLALFIGLHEKDEVNLAAGMVARFLGANKVITKINSQDLAQAAQDMEIDVVVSPRLSTARQVKKQLRSAEASLNYTTISETNMEVVELEAAPDSKILGHELKSLKLPENTLVGALLKCDNQVIIPRGNTMIEAGDKVIMVTLPESLPRLEALFASQIQEAG